MPKPDASILKKLRKNLCKGDCNIIAQRVKENHGIHISVLTVRYCINPKQAYFNEIIYNEALKLSLERKQAQTENNALQAQL